MFTQSGNTKLVFKDIYRLYNEDIIFVKENYRRYNILKNHLKWVIFIPIVRSIFAMFTYKI